MSGILLPFSIFVNSKWFYCVKDKEENWKIEKYLGVKKNI